MFRTGVVGWRDSHLVVAAAGFSVALVAALLIREPEREFSKGGVGEKGPVSESDQATAPSSSVMKSETIQGVGGEKEGLAEGDADEETRESFREALAIVFESRTVKLVRCGAVRYSYELYSRVRWTRQWPGRRFLRLQNVRYVR